MPMLAAGLWEHYLLCSFLHLQINFCSVTQLRILSQEWNRDGRYRDVEDVLRSAAYDRDSVELIGRALAKIIAGPSLSQVS